MSALLEIRDLIVGRGNKTVLSIDSLDVQESEVLAIIGPNGAGKSTLLLTLARLLKPTRGDVLFHGQSLSQLVELDYRRRIGLILQEPLLLDLTVLDNVRTGLRFRGLPKAETHRRAEEWLVRLGIIHLRARRAGSLSGGEAQRVSLARAFALQPEILLLDEPFSPLDAPTRSHLLADLQSLLTVTEVTTIFVTHDLDEALLLGDRVAVLLDGQLRQVGPPDKVFSMPADAEVATFVGMDTVIPGKVVESNQGQIVVETHNLRLEAVGNLEPGRQVLFCLRPEDVTLWKQGALPQSSARNRLDGRIQRMLPQGALMQVEVNCGIPMKVLITRASAREMGLEEGLEVTTSFKATAVHIIPR